MSILDDAKKEIEYIKNTKRMILFKGDRNLELLEGLVQEIERCHHKINAIEGYVLSLRVDVDDLIDAFKDKVKANEG